MGKQECTRGGQRTRCNCYPSFIYYSYYSELTSQAGRTETEIKASCGDSNSTRGWATMLAKADGHENQDQTAVDMRKEH